mmetsp:Transcript_34502/g.83504  ORF Transcript_34502/g.83504 Transcript_34502/m.83504 type:complete len:212 (+) Transcript_34502:561-1196(+)
MDSVRTILGWSGRGWPSGGGDVSSDTVTIWGTYRPRPPSCWWAGWSASMTESGWGVCRAWPRGMWGTLRLPGGEGGSNDVGPKLLGGGVRGSGKNGKPPRGAGEEMMLLLACIPPTGEEVRHTPPPDVSLLSPDDDDDCRRCCCFWSCSSSSLCRWLSTNSITLLMPSGSQKSAHADSIFPFRDRSNPPSLYSKTRGMIVRALSKASFITL